MSKERLKKLIESNTDRVELLSLFMAWLENLQTNRLQAHMAEVIYGLATKKKPVTLSKNV